MAATGSRVRQQRGLAADALLQFEMALRRTAATASTPTERDLIAWAEQYLPTYIQSKPTALHRWLSDELSQMVERRGTNLDVIAPRGSAKSTWVSIVYVLWCVCHHAEAFVLIASETSEQSQSFLGAVKTELEENRLLAQAYPEATGPGPKWTEKQIVTRNGIRIRAIGAGGRIRGLRQRESRPTLVIIDDAEGELASYSAPLREKIRNWFTRAVKNVGSPTTNFIVAGTMIHEDCLVSHVRTLPGWRHRIWRSVIRWPDRMDLWEKWERLLIETPDDSTAADAFYDEHAAAMNAGAEVLWPDREPLLELMRLRATAGRAAFLAEKQNEPVPPRALRFAAEWFDGDDIWFDGPPENATTFCAVDPCVGKAGTQGDMAAVVWAFWTRKDPHLYIDADIGRRPPSQTNELVVELASLYRFEFIAYESNGLQDELGADLGRRLFSERLTMPVMPIVNTQPKLLRIDSLGPLLEKRRFRFRRRSPGALALVKALKYFSHPKIEPYDGPDALATLNRSVRDFLTGSGFRFTKA